MLWVKSQKSPKVEDLVLNGAEFRGGALSHEGSDLINGVKA